ncbi:DUF5694 domain-containing protein [Yeosuana sp. MJ-SS3]|uniref:DUF5694 domain-containing protein n=1 Tax=Gilvirhabdus luticola TaxID=3079858 RepID=A0ABU3U3U4_9FLAO|nr:DUF5694 domain-containing protein [Yeosuana sp. MJ-SS3]MDU8885021.1 DUF5694 domain-containing protein [Yeosuana sp. MJ-SS3]
MKRVFLLLIFFFLITYNIVAQPTLSEEKNKPAIALLGTFHFAGSSDAMSLKVDDLSTPKRQLELDHFVNALAEFKPTKIILEYTKDNTSIDSLYKAYLKGEHTLNINERQQVGFRLAALVGHNKVYPADYYLDLQFGELMTFLEENNQMNLIDNMMSDMKSQVMDVWQNAYEKMTIKEFFAFINSHEYDAMNRNVYLEYLNKMGHTKNHLGSEIVSRWWERNFKIMSNIDAIIEPEDRVLVFLGQGHTAILKDFYKNRNDIEYVDIIQYLKN